MSNRGLFFYKLVSKYPEDVTKNCKLSITEIDSNFETLKDADIKSAEFVRDEKALVLTRNDGEKLIALLYDVAYDLNVVTGSNESGTSITISYDGENGKKDITISNLLTYDNLEDVIGSEILTKVITDTTLKGDGTMSSPLGLAGIEKTGSYAPAIKVIDSTKGEKLPIVSKLGTRYVTKEWVNDYGFLYNGSGVNQISNKLDEDGRGWRVPSKNDWDNLLNSLEPCAYRNHNSAKCHVELGKYAGHYLKSECGWEGQEPCDCKMTKPVTGCVLDDVIDTTEVSETEPTSPNVPVIGIDKYGMTILPAGYAIFDTNSRIGTQGFGEESLFWTTSHVYDDPDQDIYVKRFVWKMSGVEQVAECPDPYYSIRLVKDYDGSNYFDSEYIDGILYKTILFPETKQIWLASNYASKQDIDESAYTEVNAGEVLEKRIEFYINEWNGKYWERKRMSEGDTIVIENPDFDGGSGTTTNVCWWSEIEEREVCVEVFIPKVAQSNIEYRIYTEDDSCNKIIVNTDDLVVERVIHVIIPMLEQEREERKAADAVLQAEIEELSANTESAITELWEALYDEEEARVAADEILSGAIETLSGEVIDLREDVNVISGEVIDLREDLNAEIERAIAREDEISGLTINTDIEYIMSVSGNTEDESLVLKSKDGNSDHFVKIKFDGNFGEF